MPSLLNARPFMSLAAHRTLCLGGSRTDLEQKVRTYHVCVSGNCERVEMCGSLIHNSHPNIVADLVHIPACLLSVCATPSTSTPVASMCTTSGKSALIHLSATTFHR